MGIIFITLGICLFLCEHAVLGKKTKHSDNISYEERLQNTRYKTILNQMKAWNIKKNLRYLSEYPHHPGSKRSRKLAEHIAKQWRKSGFDKTEIFRYNIYMSYPKSPGEISLLNLGNVEKKMIIKNEPPFDETEKKGKPLYPFNAFASKGTVTGELIYCNYGRNIDFVKVKRLGIDVKGKIVLLRYGKGSRSAKVRRAQSRGCIGVIIFSDPYEYTIPGQEYPKGWMMNRYAVQRGTINWLTGDALSLGYPSKPNYFRINESKYSGNPKIPSQPISYSTAYEILKFMKNDSIPSPSGFQGGLNLTYVLSSGKGRTITLKVSTELKTKESLTVCSTLYGSQEPDRYVMIGNHRDSWTYGASDASSGTAAMMEIVKTLGHFKKTTNMRLRRSIMACSWGAEEPGVLGSTEWADEHHKFIERQVVAYLNVDMAVEGNFTIRLKALRSIKEGLFRAAKLVRAPDNPRKSLFQDWLAKSKILKNDKSLDEPSIITPSAGSDYKAFWHTYGTTIVDYRYIFSKKDFPRLSPNGHYHTLYESFGWMSKFVDPEFLYHLTIAKLWGGHCMIIADSRIIPFDLITYTKHVRYHLKEFEKAYKSMLRARKISLSFARERLDVLIKKATSFHKHVKRLDLEHTSPYELRSINDKIMNFERNFLITGLSRKLSARHVVFASAPYKMKVTKFPGISEAIYFASRKGDRGWDEVRKQITLVVWCIDTAIKSLDLSEWKY